MEGIRVPRIRSYVRTGQYTPKSGPLAGQTFTGQIGTTQAYNRYREALARSQGFSSSSEYRRITRMLSTNVGRFGNVFEQEKRNPRFGPVGVLTQQHRVEIAQAVKALPFWNGKKLDLTDPNTGQIDNSFGGKLDQYLQALKRREGNEAWYPGSTPK